MATRPPAPDTIAAILERDPWQTPLGLASNAVSRVEQALICLRLAPCRDLRAEAISQVVRARRFVFDACGLCTSQPDREQLAYLGELLDEAARELGFAPASDLAARAVA